MKPRWLLLMVSVICMLVLAPASALSQGPTAMAGCGSATIDGTVGASEWADAVALTLEGYYEPPGEVEDEPATGTLYLMNDSGYLYIGATLELPEDEHPQWWWTYLDVGFTDERCGNPGQWTDDMWAAATCADEPGEGFFWFYEEQQGGPEAVPDGPGFLPISEDAKCGDDDAPAHGVVAASGVHSAHVEMRIDLGSSQLDCVGPGDCFRFYTSFEEGFCATDDPDCGESEHYGWVQWPPADGLWEEPDEFGTVCLNPCEAEFVPEPGSILLLGSGLAGLAGYATLRWRTRE